MGAIVASFDVTVGTRLPCKREVDHLKAALEQFQEFLPVRLATNCILSGAEHFRPRRSPPIEPQHASIGRGVDRVLDPFAALPKRGRWPTSECIVSSTVRNRRRKPHDARAWAELVHGGRRMPRCLQVRGPNRWTRPVTSDAIPVASSKHEDVWARAVRFAAEDIGERSSQAKRRLVAADKDIHALEGQRGVKRREMEPRPLSKLVVHVDSALLLKNMSVVRGMQSARQRQPRLRDVRIAHEGHLLPARTLQVALSHASVRK